jgi:hypothetical protein
LSLCSAGALIILFRRNKGELATILANESKIFCFLADGVKIAGDEPKSDDGTSGVFFGAEGPLRYPLAIEVLARVYGES